MMPCSFFAIAVHLRQTQPLGALRRPPPLPSSVPLLLQFITTFGLESPGGDWSFC